MKRTLMAGFAAVALCGASFGQAGNQGNANPTGNQSQTQGQKAGDTTDSQRGNGNTTSDQTPQQRNDNKKKGKNRNDKNKKGPIDPTNPNSQGNGPTVPDPSPTTSPTTR
jgi:hypothetical protein